MTTIWLARHAETATPQLVHGAESDVGLGDHGVRQTEAVAPWFRERLIQAVISSGMLRARATAAPIAAVCGVPHEIEPQLHERMVGPYSRKTGTEVDVVWKETVRQWEAGNPGYSVSGMESFATIAARVVPAFERIAVKHLGRRVVVVAHGVVCKVLLLSLLPGYGPTHWTKIGRALNLSVSELVMEGTGWRAMQLFTVPPPVAEVNASRPPDVGNQDSPGIRPELT